MRTLLTVFLLAAGALSLYVRQLETAPVYLAYDEVTIALNAHSIAATGRDMMGRAWPLYLQITAGSWFCPVDMYLMALMLKVLPLSEFAIRLPTACVGVLNIVLMYFVGRALFRKELPAILAAVLLALTPAHFLHSRFALEYIYPLPFILAWLLCLFTYLDSDDVRWLFAGTTFLGLGFYSYIACVFLMPLYVLLTCLTLLIREKPLRTYLVASAGFLVPIVVLFVPWFITHSQAYARTVGHYVLYDTSRLNPLQGIRELLSYPSITERTTLYWDYLDPSFLFLDATASFMFSTRTAGVFLWPLVILLPVGLYQAARSKDPKNLVLVIGFLTAPLAAVLVLEKGSINRALELLPFGVLLAVAGAVYLWTAPPLRFRRVFSVGTSAIGLAAGLGYLAWTVLTQGAISRSTLPLILVSAALAVLGYVSDRTASRMVVAGIVTLAALQFLQYQRDYFTDYRSRAVEAFRGNRRGALEHIIQQSRSESVPAIYLNSDIVGIEEYWHLYLVKHGREDLLGRTVIFGRSSPLDLRTMPAGSAVMTTIADPAGGSLVKAGELRLEASIPEPGDHAIFAVLRR